MNGRARIDIKQVTDGVGEGGICQISELELISSLYRIPENLRQV
tara:strand:+ start:1332 stop:1463 length:132 start_codon:yes stop_codon:yes gene_type:complete